MSEGMISTLTNPNIIVAFLVAVAVLATFYSLAAPFLERGNLEKRMKSVATERDVIRARERVRLNAEISGGKASLRNQNNTSARQLVERLNLRKALVDDKTVNRLKSAGYRSQNALNMFLAARFCLPFLFLAVGAFYIFFLGYLAEKPFIMRLLLLICVESGVSMELAMRRVADEIAEQSAPLAEELVLTTAELSFLPERRVALENLGIRTGLDDVKSVMQALIQADRYGTPIAQALRVLAQESRDQRMNEAEKKASALPPKLTVPMILFFLPVLIAVILGPAGIQVSDKF
jgi:tight adherence protein C